MKSLNLSKDIQLPLDVVTQTIAILAKRRAGKSYTMRKLVEELFENGQQVVLIDPKGDQWGLRSSADGKKPGLPIVILGGEHGDAPLEVSAGEVVARLAAEERVSMLLDLSMFRKHEVATFMTAFLENLYRIKAKELYRTPMMLVTDEADAIAPQKPQKGEERMLGAIEDIVRRGGQRGIGCALITQRSAVLNKNVLTQAQMLIVLRTIAPQDLAAMKAWVDVHGTVEEGKELMDSLPSLPIGDAWFWSPGWPTAAGIFQRTHILPIKTFDSGATPEPGKRTVVPKNLADVDLGALKRQMAATIEKAKADDPKELKREIARLTKELASKKLLIAPKPVISQETIEKAVKVSLAKRDKEWQQYLRRLDPPDINMGVPNPSTERPEFVPPPQRLEKKFVPTIINSSDPKPLSKGAHSVLIYLRGAYPNWKSKTQMWVAAGYAPGGGFNNIVYELTGAGLIEKDGTGKYAATRGLDDPQGWEYEDPSIDKWHSKLSLGANKIFSLLRIDTDTALTKEQIAEATGYALGGGFNNLIYELTGKELVVKEGLAYKINPEILDL